MQRDPSDAPHQEKSESPLKMNPKTRPSPLIRATFIAALALALWSLPVQAQTAPPSDGKMMMSESKMMERCKEMKEKKEKMMADMKAQDSELTMELAKMNRAPENEKLGLLAALVTHLTEQRIAMDAQKAKMDGEMMQHMMQHMKMGADSMAKCPMMKDMADMDSKSDDAPKAQHEDQK